MYIIMLYFKCREKYSRRLKERAKMDFIINIANLTAEELKAFEGWHKFMSESIVRFRLPGMEMSIHSRIIMRLLTSSPKLFKAFLKSVSSKVETHKRRTMGFGEDMPRWSHENGRFVRKYGSFVGLL